MLSELVLTAATLSPPHSVGGWTRSESPQTVKPADIFAYMDGAGELYLAYRLVELEAYEYLSTKEQPILLEIYRLESADDGYGLLSGDWGGEAVSLDPSRPQAPPRAL